MYFNKNLLSLPTEISSWLLLQLVSTSFSTVKLLKLSRFVASKSELC